MSHKSEGRDSPHDDRHLCHEQEMTSDAEGTDGAQHQRRGNGSNSKSKSVVTTNLKRNLSIFNVIAMMVSITGHVAIFITPGSIMRLSGSVLNTFVVWFVGSFLVYSLALCFAELGTMFQRAGGPYLYISRTLGPFMGFMLAWGYFVLISGPIVAFTSSTAAVYIVKAFSKFEFCDEQTYDVVINTLAAWIMVTMMFMNCYCLKIVIRIQNFLTAAKLVAILIIILTGLVTLVKDSTENFEEPTANSTNDPGRISMALLYVIFSNGGWQAITSLMEEVKNPSQTLPRAIHSTFAINIVLLSLTYAAYLVVLDFKQISNNDAIALLFCRNVWPPLVPIMSILVALTSIGAVNAVLMGHSRLLLAVARDGSLPSVFGTIHITHKTPLVAIVTIISYGIAMLAAGGTTKMMQFIGLFSLLMGLKIVVALLYLRYKKPDQVRPYKAPLVHALLQVVVCFSLLVFVVYQEPSWMCMGLLIYAAGVPVYILGATWKNKPQDFKLAVAKVTQVIQKCFQQVPT